MIVYNIEDHTDSSLMKSLDHLLELAYTGYRIERICRIRAFNRIVVERIVTPVILIILQMLLIYCDEVSGRKQLNISDSKLLKVIDTCCKTVRILCSLLSKCKVLSLVADA